jgi:cell wall-associated NlpC family hydrolase
VTPLPGDFGVTRIAGLPGRAIRFGQWLNGSGFEDYEHSFIVMPSPDGSWPPAGVLGAQPGGARYEVNPYAAAVTRYSAIPLTTQQRAAIVSVACKLEGTPYSWLDYASIGLHRLHIRPKALEDFIASEHHMICSQLVVWVYKQAGIDLFPGRWPGDVTPGDLARLIEAK